MASPDDILNFWFVESESKDWFKKSDAFDAEIRERFEPVAIDLAANLRARSLHPWEVMPESALALIIALDQFPRNMYRDTIAAFAWDDLALGASSRMVDVGHDLKIDQPRRAFCYMPFMHSEDIANQNRCVDLMDKRLDNKDNHEHAVKHRQLIEKFGRFPHRNDILGRESTIDETMFLKEGGYAP